jgi:hypothetical protein
LKASLGYIVRPCPPKKEEKEEEEEIIIPIFLK